MESTKDKILNVLTNSKTCFIATTDGNFVDNCMVSYYSEGFTIYIGSFQNTLKCRNIEENPHVAVCVGNVQLHGMARKLDYVGKEYELAIKSYIKKFPNYAFYFELESNELYEIAPLAAWYYDSSKGTMHRDIVVFDKPYVNALKPYIAPQKFVKRAVIGQDKKYS